jgi:hypothetical protein
MPLTEGGSQPDYSPENRIIEVIYDATSTNLLVDITVFMRLVTSCFEAADKQLKKAQIQRLLTSCDWIEHYKDKTSGKRVLSESTTLEYKHELFTAIALAKVNYEVIFAPKGMFKRADKKFDIFLIREHRILKADLKYIASKNPDTIGNRIKEGCDQASCIVIDIASDIDRKNLIIGLRTGAYKNKLLQQIFLFYKGCFYVLSKNLIESKHIYDLIARKSFQ